MILSRTSQYAIQALIFIAAQPRGQTVMHRTVAERLGVPPAYLAKVMQSLHREQLLDSFRGRQGGFRLREGAEKTSLMHVVSLVEGAGFSEDCVLGLKACQDETACPMHHKWVPIKRRIVGILQAQTLEKLAAAVRNGRYRLADLPQSLVDAGAEET